jgi:hypothetical protein
MRVDLMLQKQATSTVRRMGDISWRAPFTILDCEGEFAVLPLPLSVVSGNQMLWEQKDFTADSIRGAAVLGMRDKWKDDLTGSGAELVSAYASGLWKDTQSSVGSALGGVDNLGDFIKHKEGKAVNSNKEMTFNGMGYRSFTLAFELVPLDEKQAKQIDEFIIFFQEKASPEFASPKKIYWKYPPSWEIVWSKGLKLPTIMPAYLTDYSINYAGAGKMAFHKSGHSTQTNIELTFVESTLHTRDKIKAFPG